MKTATALTFLAALAHISTSVNGADGTGSGDPTPKSAAQARTITPIETTNAVAFVQPKTLADLLALKTEQLEKVDIARINLLCAEGLRGSENLDVDDCLKTLDAWAQHVERETKRNFHHFIERPKEFNDSLPYYRMGMMGTVLAEDLRIQYNPERERQLFEKPITSQSVEDWNAFFGNSTDVFIHGLLSGKHYGTCASMPFLYVAVGRRLGYPVTIAARKYHLYLRYEAGNGTHLNMEATENRGFSTPTDEEFRDGPYPMTQSEIDGCGWLRPLSNKEILGICLLNRANCLRSMKSYDDEIKTLTHAARYVPDTALMRRVIAKNQQLARNLHAADRWDELWRQVENEQLPTGGSMFEHFQNQKLRVQLFMNQSTNLAEIEKAVATLADDLKRFRTQISDDTAKLAESFGRPQQPVNQQPFLALLENAPQPRRIRIPEEMIPPDYRFGVPPELGARLQKLTTAQAIIEEMHVYAAEEINLRNQEVILTASRPILPPLPPTERAQVKIRPEDLPLTWRGRNIPSELQDRIDAVAATGSASTRQDRIRDEINRFFIDQDQRRFALEAVQKRRAPLDKQPATRAPLQIEITSTVRDTGAAAAKSGNSPLTPFPQKQITPDTNLGKP